MYFCIEIAINSIAIAHIIRPAKYDPNHVACTLTTLSFLSSCLHKSSSCFDWLFNSLEYFNFSGNVCLCVILNLSRFYKAVWRKGGLCIFLIQFVKNMGKSCKESAQSLLDCMKNTACMKKGGEFRECAKKDSDGAGECHVINIHTNTFH